MEADAVTKKQIMNETSMTHARGNVAFFGTLFPCYLAFLGNYWLLYVTTLLSTKFC
jgi:hypothetical protein